MKRASIVSLFTMFVCMTCLLYAETSQNDLPSWYPQEQQVDNQHQLIAGQPTETHVAEDEGQPAVAPPPRPGYLEAGPALEGIEKEYNNDYSALVEVRTLRKKISREIQRTEQIEEENARLQRLLIEAEDKLFHQTSLLEAVKKEVMDNEFKAVALEQQITRLKLAVLRKKMLRESRFPPFYTVEKNDSLWKIAAHEQVYDDPYKWIEIFYANKDKIADPDFIYPGMVLVIPRPEFSYEDWTVDELKLDALQSQMNKEDLHALQESVDAETTGNLNR